MTTPQYPNKAEHILEDGLRLILDGSFVYEQVHFGDLKPQACFYLECPALDRGTFHVMPHWVNTHPQAPDTVVWTVYSRYEFNHGNKNPWIKVDPIRTNRLCSALGNIINSRESDWF